MILPERTRRQGWQAARRKGKWVGWNSGCWATTVVSVPGAANRLRREWPGEASKGPLYFELLYQEWICDRGVARRLSQKRMDDQAVVLTKRFGPISTVWTCFFIRIQLRRCLATRFTPGARVRCKGDSTQGGGKKRSFRSWTLEKKMERESSPLRHPFERVRVVPSNLGEKTKASLAIDYTFGGHARYSRQARPVFVYADWKGWPPAAGRATSPHRGCWHWQFIKLERTCAPGGRCEEAYARVSQTWAHVPGALRVTPDH